MFAMFTIARTVCCLSFSIFSVQVKWHAEYGCDLKILKTFPIKQTWPSSLSVEVIGFPRYDGSEELPTATIWWLRVSSLKSRCKGSHCPPKWKSWWHTHVNVVVQFYPWFNFYFPLWIIGLPNKNWSSTFRLG